MTHRWESKFSITKIRSTWPCSKFQQNSGHLSFSFSLFKLCLGFRGCPNYFIMKSACKKKTYLKYAEKRVFSLENQQNPVFHKDE